MPNNEELLDEDILGTEMAEDAVVADEAIEDVEQEDVKEVVEEAVEAAETPEEVEAVVEELAETYSKEEIQEALNEIVEEGGVYGHLIDGAMRGAEVEAFVVDEDLVQGLIADKTEYLQELINAVESGDRDTFIKVIEYIVEDVATKVAAMAGDKPSLDVLMAFIDAEGTKRDKRALLDLLREIELEGDVGYVIPEDADDRIFADDGFKKSKYSEALAYLADQGLSTLSQIRTGKGALVDFMNKGIVPADAKAKDTVKIAPTIVKETAAVVAPAGGDIATLMKDALAKGDAKEYARLRELKMAELEA